MCASAGLLYRLHRTPLINESDTVTFSLAAVLALAPVLAAPMAYAGLTAAVLRAADSRAARTDQVVRWASRADPMAVPSW